MDHPSPPAGCRHQELPSCGGNINSEDLALLTAPSSCCRSPAPHPGALHKGRDTTPHPSTLWHPWVTFHPVLFLGQGCRLWGGQSAAVGFRRSWADLLTLGFRRLQLGETKGTPRVSPSRVSLQHDSLSLFPIPVLRFIRFPCQTTRFPCSRGASDLTTGSDH